MKFSILFFTCSISLCQLLFSESLKEQTSTKPLEEIQLTPKEAMKKLMEGNHRFVKDFVSYADTSIERRLSLNASQNPFAIVLGCSDSRVPVELIFDQGLGDLFVIRVAGNATGPDVIDSIEYAVRHLKTSLIVVLGHENCGAIKAILSNNLVEIDQISKFLINPKVPECKNLNSCVQANAKHSVEQIKASPLINPYLKKGEIEVVAAYYDLTSGKVEILK